MEIDRLGAPTQPAQPSDTPANARLGRDAFMQLLVAQLKNQDPLEPADSKEMITQLSQLTSVEELVTMGNRIRNVEAAMSSVSSTQVSSLVGKTVTADASTLWLEETGNSTGSFDLNARAESVTVTVRDAEGRAIRHIDLGDGYPGQQEVTWDGNDDSGNRVAPGRYSIEIAAKDAAGNPVGTSTEVTGRVSRVDYSTGFPELLIGAARVRLGDVTSIAM